MVRLVPPVLLAATENHMFGAWQDVFVNVWRTHTTTEGTQQVRSLFSDFIATHEMGVGVLTIIEPGAPLPSSEVRTALARLLSDNSDKIRCSTVVFEGSGFRAAAVRSVVAGLTLLARPNYPHKVMASTSEAADFLAESLKRTLKTTWRTSDLQEAIRQLRIQL